MIDLEKIIIKQYPKDRDEIKEYINNLKNIESGIQSRLTKSVALGKGDDRATKIREKNNINIRIREIKSIIERTEDTIQRLKNSKNLGVFEKKQLQRLYTSIEEYENELQELEIKLSN